MIRNLPIPTFFKELDFEKELEAITQDFLKRSPEYEEVYLESDPIRKVLEAWAYDRVNLKNQYNEDLRQVLLPYATKENLDNLAWNHLIERRLIDAGDPEAIPPIPPTYESDEELRYRAQTADRLALTAGPASAYDRLTIEAAPDIKEGKTILPTPKEGEVHIVVRAREGVDGMGTPSQELMNKIHDYLSAEDKRPVNDKVIVHPSRPKRVNIVLEAHYKLGFSKAQLDREITAKLMAANDEKQLGEALTLNEIHARSRITGVDNIIILSPKADIEPEFDEFIYIENLEITEPDEE